MKWSYIQLKNLLPIKDILKLINNFNHAILLPFMQLYTFRFSVNLIKEFDSETSIYI